LVEATQIFCFELLDLMQRRRQWLIQIPGRFVLNCLCTTKCGYHWVDTPGKHFVGGLGRSLYRFYSCHWFFAFILDRRVLSVATLLLLVFGGPLLVHYLITIVVCQFDHFLLATALLNCYWDAWCIELTF